MRFILSAAIAAAMAGPGAAQDGPALPDSPEAIIEWVILDMTCRDMAAIQGRADQSRATPDTLAIYAALMYVQGFASARGESAADIGMAGTLACMRDLDRNYLSAITR